MAQQEQLAPRGVPGVLFEPERDLWNPADWAGLAAVLTDALDQIDDGFALYGPDDRLVLCNLRYRELYPTVAYLLVPGTHALDILLSDARASELPGQDAAALALARRRL